MVICQRLWNPCGRASLFRRVSAKLSVQNTHKNMVQDNPHPMEQNQSGSGVLHAGTARNGERLEICHGDSRIIYYYDFVQGSSQPGISSYRNHHLAFRAHATFGVATEPSSHLGRSFPVPHHLASSPKARCAPIMYPGDSASESRYVQSCD